jgi:hypothetical protein
MSAVLTASARAELSDPAYFSLWDTTATINGAAGDGTTVNLCGTAACAAGDFATFTVFNGMPSGSGFIDPFLRFQHNDGPAFNGSSTTAAAYNTEDRDAAGTYRLQDTGDPGSSFTNQAKDNNAFNHAITLGSLDGSDGYYHFLLDINEPGAQHTRTLRLEELQFFASSDGSLDLYEPDRPGSTGANKATGSLAGATKVWDMDWDGINAPPANGQSNGLGGGYGGIVLDNVNDGGGGAGSGDYDLEVMLDVNLFSDFSETDFVYLYNFAGNADRFNTDEAEAGFEEWAALALAGDGSGASRSANAEVPEPSTFVLIGTGFLGLLGVRWRRHEMRLEQI